MAARAAHTKSCQGYTDDRCPVGYCPAKVCGWETVAVAVWLWGCVVVSEWAFAMPLTGALLSQIHHHLAPGLELGASSPARRVSYHHHHDTVEPAHTT